jgi:hypothetical protein
MSDQGFLGETEARLQAVLGGSCEQSSCEDLKCDVKTLCAIVH